MYTQDKVSIADILSPNVKKSSENKINDEVEEMFSQFQSEGG